MDDTRYNYTQAQRIQPCHVCGADCNWCTAANKARLAFPRAKVSPLHDTYFYVPEEHHCRSCFLKLPELWVNECTQIDEGDAD